MELTHLIQKYHPPQAAHQSFFISFEGIEGSGKSTQIERAERFLKKQGFTVHRFREPGGTVFGEKLREAILHSTTPLDPMSECHLFLASRAQLLKEKILPLLSQEKTVVLLDRYIDSTLVYQGIARKLGFEKVLTLHQFAPLDNLPHLTIYLQIDLQTSMDRQATRGNEKDYFESETESFYRSLIQGHDELLSLFPQRIVSIDAKKDIESVASDIESTLTRCLGVSG
jgi:dTMP kinase